ncbi:MAG: 4-hydroxy-2-oxovalerate aldolase [Anaerolineae bacterium]|nr:4-hydroxy-2-oxovalerate aldolase [Anaerolineae bacterium]
MQINQTKAKLKAGEAVYGTFIRYPDPALVEYIAWQGWDFLVFDGEHGVVEPADVENLVRVAELRAVTPIARAATNQPHVILRMMDTGAQGVHIPWVNGGDEAEQAVQSVKYHPRGMRGLASSRAADFGMTVPLKDYVAQANRETLVIVHIETMEAVNRIDEYLAIDDLDVIFIGPTDLSQSMGLPGERTHPDVIAAMMRVVEAVKPSGKFLGTMVSSAESALEWKARGVQYITITLEGLMRSACQQYLKAVRG